MTWNHGEDVQERTNKQMLREQGFPDADTCPMPAEHTGCQELHVYQVDGVTTMCKSETEWIKGKTWGEL